jgi:hypothetical protein
VAQALPHTGGKLLLFNVSLELDLVHDPGASGKGGKDAANSLLRTRVELERSTEQGARQRNRRRDSSPLSPIPTLTAPFMGIRGWRLSHRPPALGLLRALRWSGAGRLRG